MVWCARLSSGVLVYTIMCNGLVCSSALNIFQSYCDKWKLTVKVNKTKVLVFSKRKCQQNFDFTLNGENLDIIDSYIYLGITLKYNGSFVDARKRLVEHAQKSLFAIYKKIRNQNIPIDLQLKLFDSLVESIILYGSEVWGFENIQIMEKIHLKFCKRILNMRLTMPNYMVFSELGRYPLEIRVKLRMVSFSFWTKLIQSENKLSSILYRLILQIHQSGNHVFKWISFVMSIFDNTGLSYIFFANQLNNNIHLLKSILKERLNDHFIQQWFTDVENSSRGEFYLIFEFGFEKYLSKLSVKNRINLSKFRCSNVKFPIETGRWQNIARNDRMCTFCRENIGDEFHYLFICKYELIAL